MTYKYTGSYPIERVTGARPVIDSNHAQVHDKNAFEFGYSKQLAPAGVMAFALEVPANAYVHFQATKIIYAGGITFEMIEGATFANGTERTPSNKHRIGSDNSIVTVTVDVDTIVGGDDLFGGPLYLGRTGTPARISVGGATGDTSEWVLKPSTTYIFRVTSLETSETINIAIVPFWYEESGA